MGSIVGTVGDKFGLRIPATGALVNGTNYILTSIYLPKYPAATATNIYIYAAFEYGWRAFIFQGAGGAGAQVNVTIDGPTASGVVGASVWSEVPVPSVGNPVVGSEWTNPITAGNQLLFVNSGPWAAFQIVPTSAGGYISFGAGG